jgi:hypothetical protein
MLPHASRDYRQVYPPATDGMNLRAENARVTGPEGTGKMARPLTAVDQNNSRSPRFEI